MMTKLLIKLCLLVVSSQVDVVFTVTTLKKHHELLRRNHSPGNISDIYTVDSNLPIVINTWPFVEAGTKAWEVLSEGGSALDAVEQGCTTCEELQCDGTVGYGGSPDENGETTLDAMIMDGETHNVGAVGALRRVKSAISVARYVMEYTQHTLLVGSQATEFARMMGFPEENLTTPESELMYSNWKENYCQPNFWKNVQPDSTKSCGPYTPIMTKRSVDKPLTEMEDASSYNHDTIGMIAIDSQGQIAGGTSTNGLRHKIPGRVGDSPIPGCGAYVDKKVGGAAATGDGDVMMRFMPSLVAVDGMRMGQTPDEAAASSLQRIVEYYPSFSGAVVTLSIKGEYGAACNNLHDSIFRFTVGNANEGVHLQSVSCLEFSSFNSTSSVE